MQKRPPKVRKLTDRQQRFCHEYLKDLNGAAAARRAGFAPKYADRQAQELLEKPHVRARIAELVAARNARCEADADWVLRRLIEELQADAADIFDAAGALKHPSEWPEIWRKGLVAGIQVTELYSKDSKGQNVRIGQLKNIQFADRTKKLELLGKHTDVRAFKDRVQISADEGLKQLFEQISGRGGASPNRGRVQARP